MRKIKKIKKTIDYSHLDESRRAAKGKKKLTPKERWKNNRDSLRLSIDAKCYECIGEENHIGRIKHCDIFDCPLWDVRPYRKGITKEDCLNWKEPSLKISSEAI